MSVQTRMLLRIALIELDLQDLSVALTSLITTAAHDDEPEHDICSIVEAVKKSGTASDLVSLISGHDAPCLLR